MSGKPLLKHLAEELWLEEFGGEERGVEEK